MLKNKNLVIIGGTSGIGLAAALAFAREGAKVLLVGLDEDSCAAAAVQIGDKEAVICGDACREKTPKEAINRCLEKYGGFDGLYHVAGGSGRKWGDGPLHEIMLDGWNKTLELNLTSIMLSNKVAIQTFLENKTAGTILNLSSVLAFSPSPDFFASHAYATAKAGIIGFSKSVAAYYAKYNIRVNVLAPALVESPMSKRARENEEIMTFIKSKQVLDGGRIGKAEDLIGLACYFMSDYSIFTTGQVISVDGGWSINDGQISNKL